MSEPPAAGLGAGTVPRGRAVPGGDPGLIAGKGAAAAWDARAQGRPIIAIASDPAIERPGERPGATVLVLVADRLIRKLLTEALRFAGLHALGAADLEQAETVLRASRLDVVVLDPRLSRHRAGSLAGSLAEWVAGRPALHGVPILVLTGFSAGDDDRRLRGLAYRALIPGPVSVPKLFRSIEAVLGRAVTPVTRDAVHEPF